jgi:hypothetical protein
VLLRMCSAEIRGEIFPDPGMVYQGTDTSASPFLGHGLDVRYAFGRVYPFFGVLNQYIARGPGNNKDAKWRFTSWARQREGEGVWVWE